MIFDWNSIDCGLPEGIGRRVSPGFNVHNTLTDMTNKGDRHVMAEFQSNITGKFA